MRYGGGILTRMKQHRLLHPHITPGMSATVDIRMSTRSILEFLLSPLARRAQEAGRER
jgi:hypothetical protein